jgi:D-threo-aldose 1-dehydrogenase
MTADRGFAASRLGFGCSALLSGRTRREARYLLDVAFAEGIRHYDVARVYGSGDAEAVLGQFVSPLRERVTIASKFGLRSRFATTKAAPLKLAVRAATRRSKRLVRVLRRHGRAAVVRGAFSPHEMRASLEQSLDALKIDSLDVWLLHDCEPIHWLDESLVEALDAAVARGDVRRVGTATGFDETCSLFEQAERRPDVVQFEDDPSRSNAAAFRTRFSFDAIATHGAFRADFTRLVELVRRDDPRTELWERTLGVDVRSADTLAALMLASLLDSNPNGVVLFFSSSADRIRANARVAADSPFTPDQVEQFRRLVRASR